MLFNRVAILGLLACLATQLLPRASAQYIDDPFSILAACPSGFESYPNCIQQQCQGSCCFSAGFCTDSNNNNCENQSPTFPKTTGTKANNYPNSGSDGCYCEYNITSATGDDGITRPRDPCVQTSTITCWGVVACDPALGNNTICATEGRCTVSIAWWR